MIGRNRNWALLVAGLQDWQSGWVFTDAFKQSRAWTSGTTEKWSDDRPIGEGRELVEIGQAQAAQRGRPRVEDDDRRRRLLILSGQHRRRRQRRHHDWLDGFSRFLGQLLLADKLLLVVKRLAEKKEARR